MSFRDILGHALGQNKDDTGRFEELPESDKTLEFRSVGHGEHSHIGSSVEFTEMRGEMLGPGDSGFSAGRRVLHRVRNPG